MTRKIDDYLLIRHTPNGREFPNLDCWGLIVDAYREQLNIELNDYTDLRQKDMTRGLMWERQRGGSKKLMSRRTMTLLRSSLVADFTMSDCGSTVKFCIRRRERTADMSR